MRRSGRFALAFLFASWFLVASVPCAGAPGRVPGFVRDSDWIEVRTRHLILVTDGESGATWDIARRLERFRRALEAFHPTLRAPEGVPMTIVVFKDEAELEAYSHPNSENLAAYFLPGQDRNFLVLHGDSHQRRLQNSVFHEFSHAFFHANMPAVPLWLHEGLAEYLATCRLAVGRAEFGYPDRTWAGALKDHDVKLLDLEMLFAVKGGSAAYQRDNELRDSFYATAYLLTHYLRSPKEGQADKFDKFLGRLQRGAVPAEAFRESFPLDTWPAIARALPGHLERLDFEPTQRVPLADSDLDDDIRERRLSQVEVLVQLGELQLALGAPGSASAESHFAAALELDPKSAVAMAELGLVADRAGDGETAERRYAEALALAPTAARVWNLSAQGARWRGGLAASAASGLDRKAVEHMQLARDRYARALVLEPGNLEAMGGSGAAQAALDEAPDSLTIARLTRALELQPGRVDLAAALAMLHQRSGNREAARTLVETRMAPVVGRKGGSQLRADLERSIEVEDLQAAGKAWRDSSEAVLELAIRSGLDSARPGFRRLLDSAPDEEARAWVDRTVAGMEAQERLAQAVGLIRSKRYQEAQKLLSDPGFTWPEGELLLARDRALRGLRGQLEIERALGLVKAGRLAEARAVFEAVVKMDVPDDMRDYARARASDLAGR